MAVLQSTNVQGTLCVNGVAVGGGKDFKFCCFTASDTFTPTQDLVDGDGAIDTTLVGGGGGGGFTSVGTIGGSGFTTQNYAWCKIACGGMGGGAGMGKYLQDISATDACAVTVGAGGVASAATEICFCNCAGWDPEVLTANPGTGGDSSFGDHTESGGGGGCSRRCYCIAGGFGEVGYNTAATFNGSPSYQDWGGGAADNTFVGGYNFDLRTNNCQMYANLPFLDRNQNWGATSNSSSYHFYPSHQNCKSVAVNCQRTLGTFTNGEYIMQPFVQNNGVRLDGGQVVGTNKMSLFENGTCASNFCCTISGSLGGSPVVYSSTSSVTDAINCGGAAGRDKLVVCSANVCGTFEVQQQNGKGGEGLVILKWFE